MATLKIAFASQWGFIRKFQLDKQHGGWFVLVSREGVPMGSENVARNKMADSKVTYHTARSMLNIADLFAAE